MQRDGADVFSVLRGRSALAEAGIVDRAALDRAVDAFIASPRTFSNSEALFCTLQAELWLRSRTSELASNERDSNWNDVGTAVPGRGAHV
jgi:hypothetical protein